MVHFGEEKSKLQQILMQTGAYMARGSRAFLSLLFYKGITDTACLCFRTLHSYNSLSVGTTAVASCFTSTMQDDFFKMKCVCWSLLAVAELEAFVTLVRKDPSVLHRPELAFFRDYLHSLGARIPSPPAEDEPEEPEVSQLCKILHSHVRAVIDGSSILPSELH